MSFIFFGSSIPVDIVNIVQVKRASSCTHATLKRESYLLNSIRSSRHDRIIFVTTGFSEEKASFPTKVYFNQFRVTLIPLQRFLLVDNVFFNP